MGYLPGTYRQTERCVPEQPGPTPRVAPTWALRCHPHSGRHRTPPTVCASSPGPSHSPAAVGPGGQHAVSDCPPSTQDKPQTANTPQPPTQDAAFELPASSPPGPQPPSGHQRPSLSCDIPHSSACPKVLATGLTAHWHGEAFVTSTAPSGSGPCPRDFALLSLGWLSGQLGHLFPEVASAVETLPAQPSASWEPTVRTQGKAAPS